MNTYGLIGYPLGHSFSRKFFTEKFAKEGIDAQYLNFEIPSIEEFPNIIKNNPTLKGLNVTIPYKQQVMQYLDDISEEAKAIGAVNVVKVEHLPGFDGKVAKDVKLTGHNSDVIGFVESINPLLKPHHKKALIFGTGGASKAIRYGLEKKLGMETLFVSRSARKGMITYEEVTDEVLREYEVIVNCSPVGMYPHMDECPALPYGFMSENHLLYDLVYNPEETLFMKKGATMGASVKNGHEMLIRQALASWTKWNQ
jgi:shikimate dehydrogenase